MAGRKRWLVLAVLVLSCVLPSLSGAPGWLSRAIVISVAFFLVPTVLLGVGLSPRSEMIGKGAKLNQARFDKVRPKITLGLRVVFVAIGVLVFFFVTVPVARDMLDIVGRGKPVVITGKVEDWASPSLFSLETVRLSGAGPSYDLAFFIERFQTGASYRLIVLPYSQFVLGVRKSNGPAP